jgi:hypothetical protein
VFQLMIVFSKTAGHISQSKSPISQPLDAKEAIDGLENGRALRRDVINEFKLLAPLKSIVGYCLSNQC